MKHVLLFVALLAACSAESPTDDSANRAESSLIAVDTDTLQPGIPLECAPPHVPGILRCDEIDPLTNPTCKAFEEACAEPSCPADWPIPIARNYHVAQRPGCLNSNAGVPACTVPFKNNEVFIDCCNASVLKAAPMCSIDSDCPPPIAECWDAWCNAAGICGADKAKPYGTTCSLGHCEAGRCVP